jgi:uncharacterized protein
MAISQALMEVVRHEFALPLDGIHGEAHWARVCENGLRLAQQTGADPEILELFAYLHDVRREDDGWDPEHGSRSAEFVRSLQGSLLTLPEKSLRLLVHACAYHSAGLTEGDITVQTCWDADRLDLGRIGIRPHPTYLCTDAARDPAMIEWALRRSQEVIFVVE